MPAEPEGITPPPEDPNDLAAWERLAHDAQQWPDHPGVQALREDHVDRLLHEKGLGHLAMDKDAKAGARFLHKYGTADQREVNQVVKL